MYKLQDIINRARETGHVGISPAYTFEVSDPYDIAFAKLAETGRICSGKVEYLGMKSIKVWAAYEEGYWVLEWTDKTKGVDTISFWSAQTATL